MLVLVLTGSLLFVRAKPDRSGSPSRVSITERGVPQQAPDERPWDRPVLQNRGTMPAPPGAPPGAAPSPIARKDDERSKAAEPAAGAPVQLAARSPGAAVPRGEGFQGAPPSAREIAAKSKGADDSVNEMQSEAAEGAGAVAMGELAPAAESPREPAADFDRKHEAAGSGGAAADPYAAAMALYSAGRFAEAERAFSAVAASGGKNAPSAALYASKSAEAYLGCGSAAAKYESVASRYGSTSAGAEALWYSAGCYKTLGFIEKARSHYMTLRSVAGYRDRAEAELANLAPATRSGAKTTTRPAAPAAR
jgi:TolA-binding protein